MDKKTYGILMFALAFALVAFVPPVRAEYGDTSKQEMTYSGGYQTDQDVGMTEPAMSDNLDQGRLDNRGTISGPYSATPSTDRTFPGITFYKPDRPERYDFDRTDQDVGMTNPALTDNLDQGRLDKHAWIGSAPEGAPSTEQDMKRYQTDRDVGMTNPALTDNLDQGRYNNRRAMGEGPAEAPSTDRAYGVQPKW